MTKEIKVENGYLLYSDSEYEKNTIEIEEIEVKEKRKGTGSELVNRLKDIALKEGKNITLCASPLDDSISIEDLVEFYEKLGFSIDFTDGNVYIMKY